LKLKFKIQARADLLMQENYIRDLARAGCDNIWMERRVVLKRYWMLWIKALPLNRYMIAQAYKKVWNETMSSLYNLVTR
jgi:hypothetical protein